MIEYVPVLVGQTPDEIHLSPAGGKKGNQLCLLRTGDGVAALKCYQGRDALGRRNREHAMLALWCRHGLAVPTLSEEVAVATAHPYLVLSFLSGFSIRAVLRDAGRRDAEKLMALGRVYRAMRDRHALAFETGNPRLIHPHCDTGNVMLCKEQVTWIDLEAPLRFNDVAEGAAAEIAEFTRAVVSDLSISWLARVCEVVCGAYAGLNPLLDCVWRQTCDRPFQIARRGGNFLRKHLSPRQVTAYDVADGLCRSLHGTGWRPRLLSQIALQSAAKAAFTSAQPSPRTAIAPVAGLQIYKRPHAADTATPQKPTPVSPTINADGRTWRRHAA